MVVFFCLPVELTVQPYRVVDPGAHFTNDVSIVIQIWWEICFSVTPL